MLNHEKRFCPRDRDAQYGFESSLCDVAYGIVSDLGMTLFPQPMAPNYYGRRMLAVRAIRSIVSP